MILLVIEILFVEVVVIDLNDLVDYECLFFDFVGVICIVFVWYDIGDFYFEFFDGY